MSGLLEKLADVVIFWRMSLVTTETPPSLFTLDELLAPERRTGDRVDFRDVDRDWVLLVMLLRMGSAEPVAFSVCRAVAAFWSSLFKMFSALSASPVIQDDIFF